MRKANLIGANKEIKYIFFKFLMLIICTLITFLIEAQGNDTLKQKLPANIGIEFNETLIETLSFSKGFTVYYNYPFYIKGKHQFELAPRFAGIFMPDIQTKYLIGANANYKFCACKGLEAKLYLGLHYALTWLAYDRYEYENNIFVNKGRHSSTIAPTIGGTIGYKFWRKRKYSIAPYIGFGVTKLNKQYMPNFFAGYKPSIAFGITLYKK